MTVFGVAKLETSIMWQLGNRKTTKKRPTPLAADGAIAPDNQQVLPADVLAGDGNPPEPPRQ